MDLQLGLSLGIALAHDLVKWLQLFYYLFAPECQRGKMYFCWSKLVFFLKNEMIIKNLCADVYFLNKMYPFIKVLCHLGQCYRVK